MGWDWASDLSPLRAGFKEAGVRCPTPDARSAMLPGMAGKPRIAIAGAGNLGSALVLSLRQAGYAIDAVIAHSRGAPLRKARKLAEQVGARPSVGAPATLNADVVWFCVPDGAIASAAAAFDAALSRATKKPAKSPWKGRVVLHSSGALSSDELAVLRKRGASIGSVHPLMTFVRGSQPSLAGVSFAIEGTAAAVRMARRIVKDLGGEAHLIRKKDKAAYHAWGTFASPLFTALLATTEQVAAAAGVGREAAKRRMIPILQQTLENYAALDAASAFSGPIVRGDVDTVKRHLKVLKTPETRDVYLSLARAALRYLPAKNRVALEKGLRSPRR
jgi:predicted short-subunit dehydrogenase-like oxidoreductase (DUF2520 family)